jgi:hypothetical protein
LPLSRALVWGLGILAGGGTPYKARHALQYRSSVAAADEILNGETQSHHIPFPF